MMPYLTNMFIFGFFRAPSEVGQGNAGTHRPFLLSFPKVVFRQVFTQDMTAALLRLPQNVPQLETRAPRASDQCFGGPADSMLKMSSQL